LFPFLSFFFENEKIELLIKNQHIPGRKKNIPHCTLWELCTLNSIAEFGNPGEGFMVWLDIVSTCELGSGKATNCSDRSKPEKWRKVDYSPCVKIHEQLHPRYIKQYLNGEFPTTKSLWIFIFFLFFFSKLFWLILLFKYWSD
jgi:hypothetical protein